MFYIFAFKSRTSCMSFYDSLRREGVAATVINTPPAAQIGCGLSVKVDSYCLHAAKTVFYAKEQTSFLGLFKITYSRSRYYVDRLI